MSAAARASSGSLVPGWKMATRPHHTFQSHGRQGTQAQMPISLSSILCLSFHHQIGISGSLSRSSCSNFR